MHQKVQVVLILEDQKKSFLLLMQTNQKRGAFWQNITGSVEKEDQERAQHSPELTWLLAAQRELLEETGIKLDLTKFIDLKMTYQFKDRFSREVEEKCFLALTSGVRPEIKIDPKEHQAFRWITGDNLEENLYKYPLNFECTLKAFEMIGKK